MNLDQAETFRRIKRFEGEYSDGCTFAPELGTPCCEMHDFLRRFQPEGITPAEADKLLRECLKRKGHPILSWVYWSIVVLTRKIGVYR